MKNCAIIYTPKIVIRRPNKKDVIWTDKNIKLLNLDITPNQTITLVIEFNK